MTQSSLVASKKIGLGMAPLRGPPNSPEVLALAFRTQFLSGQVLHGMFPLLCKILCLWVTVRTSPDSMVGIIPIGIIFCQLLCQFMVGRILEK